MPTQNGRLVLLALQQIREPATITEIVKLIASGADVPPGDIKQSVQETVNAGIEFGFIQRVNRRYIAVNIAAVAEQMEEAAKNNEPAISKIEEKSKRKQVKKGRVAKRRAARRVCRH